MLNSEMYQIMEQKEFETLISAYTDKIVDEDCKLVKYVISKSLKTDIINRSGEVIAHHVYKAPRAINKTNGNKDVGRPSYPVVTPKGTFLNVYHAAQAYGITDTAMRSKIRYHATSKYPQFFFDKVNKYVTD